ncbi:uncharacterized protein [Montipora foliosa]|uniref:uncharacterized protein n=1 Tax=Montipora foliosa TaxID=591990 RepID=UPI0035F1074B
MAKLMLLFLAVFAVFQVQGGSLYDQRFKQEARDLDTLEQFHQDQLDPLEQLLKRAPSAQRKEGMYIPEYCEADVITGGYCWEFHTYCGPKKKELFSQIYKSL